MLAGHDVRHCVPYNKYPEMQLEQDVLVVHVRQGVTQSTQTIGICVVSGYMRVMHSDRHVLVVVVRLRYLNAELVLQLMQ